MDFEGRPLSTRRRMLLVVPAGIAPFGIAFGAIGLLTHGEKLAGLGLLMIGVITGVLAFRRMLAFRTVTTADEGVGNLSGPAFDHLIWVAIGIPIAFGVLLLLMLMDGAL